MAFFSNKCLVLFQALLIGAQFGVKCSAKVSAVIVFGDSSVDSGNNNWIPTLARSDFPPYGEDLPGGRPTGRFCNGKLASDFASSAFGLKELVPAYLNPAFGISDFATGVNFASAGAGYDDATSAGFPAIPLWKQVEFYKEYQQRLRTHMGDEAAAKVIANALHLISIGTNDIFKNHLLSPFTMDDYHRFLIGIADNLLRQLYRLGARKIGATAILPMGCLPLVRTINVLGGHTCQDNYNAVSRSFNAKLEKLVGKLSEELDQIDLKLADLYAIFTEILTNPETFGFEVEERGCCGTGEIELGFLCNRLTPFTCSDPDKYVFWDSFHPSERTNKIIVDYLINNGWSRF